MSEILVAKNITKIYGIGTSHTFEALHGVSTVSYTHLDVYKRQRYRSIKWYGLWFF